MLKRQVVSRLSTLAQGDPEKIDFKLICESAFQGDKLAFSLLDEMEETWVKGL
jgi:hypothetical protein